MNEEAQLAEAMPEKRRSILAGMENADHAEVLPDEDDSADAGRDDDPEADDAAFADASPYARPAASEAHLCEWIAAIARSDEAALGSLYDALQGRVHGLALRITRNVQSAEEVTEDVFWQVWRQAARFDPARGKVLAWVLNIARSRALDNLRRKDEAETHPEPESLRSDLASMADNPQDLLAATRRDHHLHRALTSLDAVPRQLLALSFFGGLSHEEIARHADLPLGTVKSHIRRALATLKRVLGADPASLESIS